MDVLTDMVNDSSVEAKEVHPGESDAGRVLGLLPVFILILIIFVRLIFVLYKSRGQKTRNPQQRRTYMGSRSQTSLPPSEPTIYVSPANLPPPPKYEAMAPPSYEEVVGIHYPAYQPPIQPINQPITNALASQSSNSVNSVPSNVASNDTNTNNTPTETTTVTTVDERRPVTATT